MNALYQQKESKNDEREETRKKPLLRPRSRWRLAEPFDYFTVPGGWCGFGSSSERRIESTRVEIHRWGSDEGSSLPELPDDGGDDEDDDSDVRGDEILDVPVALEEDGVTLCESDDWKRRENSIALASRSTPLAHPMKQLT